MYKKNLKFWVQYLDERPIAMIYNSSTLVFKVIGYSSEEMVMKKVISFFKIFKPKKVDRGKNRLVFKGKCHKRVFDVLIQKILMSNNYVITSTNSFGRYIR